MLACRVLRGSCWAQEGGQTIVESRDVCTSPVLRLASKQGLIASSMLTECLRSYANAHTLTDRPAIRRRPGCWGCCGRTRRPRRRRCGKCPRASSRTWPHGSASASAWAARVRCASCVCLMQPVNSSPQQMHLRPRGCTVKLVARTSRWVKPYCRPCAPSPYRPVDSDKWQYVHDTSGQAGQCCCRGIHLTSISELPSS